MTKAFLDRIKREGIVDTTKYRYVIDGNTGDIKRIPISYLSTTKALDNDSWEIVTHM